MFLVSKRVKAPKACIGWTTRALALGVDEERRSVAVTNPSRDSETADNDKQNHRLRTAKPRCPQTNYKLGANFKLSSKLPGIARLISPRPRCLKYQFLFCFCPSISRRSLDDFI